jgi:subtilisin family serine protease
MLVIAVILALLMPFAAGVAQASFNAPPAPGAPGGEVPVNEVADLLKNPSDYVYLVVELTDEPATQVYARERTVRTENEAVSAAQAQIQRIKRAQDRFINALLSQGILKNVKPAVGDTEFVVYQTQRVYNGVALRVKAEKIPQIAQLSGVKAIHRLNLKTFDNSYSVPLINAPQVWNLNLGNTGNGIRVGIIDTGIDYLHTNFGGPGMGYDENDTTVVGDVPNYPGVKVIGGYDFVGDDYDASGESGNPIPQPDPDPMDCNGHGSHVAGTVAGYGVLQDGSTYSGPYGPGAYSATNFYIGPGVAPQAQLVALRVFGCEGSTAVTDLAIEWAVDPNGDGDFSDHLDVINMSLGSGYGSEYDTSAIASNNAALAGVIVVASAGNSYDTYYITGSPAVATRAISVASSIDAQDIMDAFEVTAASQGHEDLVGWHGSYHSANYNWAAMTSPVTGVLKLPPSDNTGGCTSFPSGYFTDTIALLDWTFLSDGETNECGSATRVGNAYAAGQRESFLFTRNPI